MPISSEAHSCCRLGRFNDSRRAPTEAAIDFRVEPLTLGDSELIEGRLTMNFTNLFWSFNMDFLSEAIPASQLMMLVGVLFTSVMIIATLWWRREVRRRSEEAVDEVVKKRIGTCGQSATPHIFGKRDGNASMLFIRSC